MTMTTVTLPPGTVAATERLQELRSLTRRTGRRWARRLDLDRGDAQDLAQEAAIGLWQGLLERPDAPMTYLKDVARHAVRDALKRGKSVDRPLHMGRTRAIHINSLEAMMEDEEDWDNVEAAVIRHRHRGELPKPTEEAALAGVLYQDLRDLLTQRQRQVLELRLQDYRWVEIGDELGISITRVKQIIACIREKALPLWEEEAPE